MRDEKMNGKDLVYNKVNLSIIVPVYNTSKYLGRCLDSLVEAVNGTQYVIEVLVINDGSTDRSEAIIDEYCKNYRYIKKFNKTNGGLSDVKNYGLKRVTGEFVIFLDSDDYVAPQMYHSMLAKAYTEKADIVICDIELAYDDPQKNTIHSCVVPSRSSMFAKCIDLNMMPASWNKIVKRELYEGLEFPVGKNNEDIAVTPILLAKANHISVINQPYYKYYQREGSIQNSKFDEKRFVIIDTCRMCIDQIDEFDPSVQEMIKGSIYVHQILSMVFYIIRREHLIQRYRFLKKYMSRVQNEFSDIWDNAEVNEFMTWDSKWVQRGRRMAIYLMRKKQYFVLSSFWGICNILYDHIYLKFFRR